MYLRAIRLNRLLVCVTVLHAGLALAQAPTPGQIEDTLKQPPQLQTPSAPVIRTEQAAPAVAGQGRKIVVSKFVFSGNTVYDSATLENLVKAYLDRPVSLMDIYAAADTITDYYAAHGYSLASVTVPAQKISGGIIRLEISEGRVARISVTGNHLYDSDQVMDYLGGVKAGQLYRGDQLDSSMRTLNALPGLKAKAVVKPGDAYGTSDVVIETQEQPYTGALLVDTYGRDDIGRTRFGGTVTVNNPTHTGDQLQLLALTSNNGLLKYYYGAYSLPVGFDGTRLVLSYGHADFKVDGKFKGVEGKNDSGKAMIEQPLIRSIGDTLSVNYGVSRTNGNADFSGAPLTGTSITLLELGGTYNHVYADRAITQVTANVASNFSKRKSLTDISDQRLKIEMDIQHLQPIFDTAFSVLVRLNGAYSPDPLVDAQQYSLGGPQSVRGFQPAEVRGDRGYLGSVTLQRPFHFGDAILNPRVFADSGRVFTIDSPADTSLSSAGVGLDGHYDRLDARLDWAYPLGDHPSGDGRDHGRLYGSLAVAF
ncbi:MAG TPA: ShlB/FhaC/HecB family hemolysin secretion/activation protein [Stenotrophobium sp.]|nr:ShlB/FhaC/HecB family hemolysin secretion/activation protein [Stenotrophobium sp.]